MRHATKMLLIPEDVYKALLTGSKSSQASKRSANMNAENTDVSTADQMLANSRQKLVKIKRARGVNPDARHINYIQEFKRYKKYGEDVASKPVNVHVNNLDQMATAVTKVNDGKKAGSLRQAVLQDALERAQNQGLNDSTSLADALPVENAVTVQQSLSTNKNKAINKKQVASPNKILLRSTIQPRKKYSPYQRVYSNRPKRINRDQIISKTHTATTLPSHQPASFKATVWNR